ncbi:hypothetical protein V6N13_148596 [Hibiscus sabdariffa]|uniref:Uncharacterized protein n=1 Tax=Hibiscus sabdariffa TaxID=183260 RepID=A0ABR2TYW8_9ROSI
MAGKPAIMAIFIAVMMLLLAQDNAASSSHDMSSEAPSPQPQPPNNFTMHGITQGSLLPQECEPRCSERCSNTQYKKPCLFFCNKCCAKCLCVPPGTYGNKQVCPCYNNWKTKRGGPKCP